MKANKLLLAARHPAAVPLPIEGELPSLGGATAWLNSPPLAAADLRGKVVLIDFWTYTCINWLRTLPYVRAWAEKYRDHAVVVIGVHTPEFSFEHDLENVRRAAKDMRIEYPIAIDNDYAIWSAFNNHYWPALYRTLRLPVVQSWTSRASMLPPRASRSIIGPFRVIGRWSNRPRCSTRPTGGSRTAFTPAISISSWDRQCEELPCDFACSSMDSRRALLTELTLTTRATARLPNSGSIS